MIKYSIISDERGQRGFWRPLEQPEIGLNSSARHWIPTDVTDIVLRFIQNMKACEIEEFFREMVQNVKYFDVWRFFLSVCCECLRSEKYFGISLLLEYCNYCII